MRHYEEMEEIIVSSNGAGGRPMALGKTLFKDSTMTDCERIEEFSTIRYHLGHCSSCGKRIVIGQELATRLVEQLQKKGISPRPKPNFRVRFAKMVLGNHGHVDNISRNGLIQRP